MNWGKWIVVSFILFALFIGVLVFFCIREDVSLVSIDYYRDELAYQDQIDRLNNTNHLKVKPVIDVSGHTLAISYDRFSTIEKGAFILYRPSNSRLDKRFVLLPGAEKSRTFDLGSLPNGMYRARMLWSMDGKQYFMESIVNL